MRFIDKEAIVKFPTIEELAKEIAKKAMDEYEYNGKTLRQWADMLSKGDAVEVVRCKDCKHYNPCGVCDFISYGGQFGWTTKDDDFCSYGERKEQ